MLSIDKFQYNPLYTSTPPNQTESDKSVILRGEEDPEDTTNLSEEDSASETGSVIDHGSIDHGSIDYGTMVRINNNVVSDKSVILRGEEDPEGTANLSEEDSASETGSVIDYGSIDYGTMVRIENNVVAAPPQWTGVEEEIKASHNDNDFRLVLKAKLPARKNRIPEKFNVSEVYRNSLEEYQKKFQRSNSGRHCIRRGLLYPSSVPDLSPYLTMRVKCRLSPGDREYLIVRGGNRSKTRDIPSIGNDLHRSEIYRNPASSKGNGCMDRRELQAKDPLVPVPLIDSKPYFSAYPNDLPAVTEDAVPKLPKSKKSGFGDCLKKIHLFASKVFRSIAESFKKLLGFFGVKALKSKSVKESDSPSDKDWYYSIIPQSDA